MKLNVKKERFPSIDGAFAVLRETPTNKAALDIIKKCLEDTFPGCEFNVYISESNDTNKPFYVMSVFPEISIMDKIIEALMKNQDSKVIQKMWEANKKWSIEIDSRLIKDQTMKCTDRELTAILLHEAGHIICSNSIPNRISLILRYEIAKTNINTKMLLKDKLFRFIMAFPIIDSCIGDSKKDSSALKEEIKADKFVRSVGYEKELFSVLSKISNKTFKNSTDKEKIKNNTEFSVNTLNEIQKRREEFPKKYFKQMKEACSDSPYLSEYMSKLNSMYFEDGDRWVKGTKFNYVCEHAEKVIDEGLFEEFFIFGKTKLKRIDPAELDYIAVQAQSILNNNDKMMLLSYLHSKLDTVNYYISILQNPETAKKYVVPHTLESLEAIKNRLEVLRLQIINFKIPERNKNILVSWPDGYEG